MDIFADIKLAINAFEHTLITGMFLLMNTFCTGVGRLTGQLDS